MMTRSSRRARRYPSRSRLRRMRMLNSHQILHAKVLRMMQNRPRTTVVTTNHPHLPRAWQAYRRRLYFDRRILLLTNVGRAAWCVGNSQLERHLTTTQVPMRQRAVNVIQTVHHVTAKYKTCHRNDFQQSGADKSKPKTTRTHGG